MQGETSNNFFNSRSPSNAKNETEFEAAVFTTRKWDASEAGAEIGKKIKNMKNTPKLVLLFSTIHYENHGGFQNFLDAIRKEVSRETQIVGGTVAGFMNNDGCFTRGATALAIYSNEMDLVTGFGRNTKRNPKKAARELNKMLSAIKQSTFENKLIFENMSNGEMPILPFLGQRKIILYPFNSILMTLISKLFGIFQYGVGREDEILENISREFKDFKIIAVANFDDFKARRSYQFYNNSVFRNAVVGAAIATNSKIEMNTSFGLVPTSIRFKINNKNFYNCAFRLIDSKPATYEFLKKLNWSKEYLNEQLYSKCIYYPIAEEFGPNQKIVQAHCLGLVMGDYLCFTYQFKGDSLRLYTTSGKRLIEAAKENIAHVKSNNTKIKAVFGVECAIRLNMLASGVYKVWNEMSKSLGKIPFLIVYGAGEGRYTPGEQPQYFNYAFNTITFSDQK